MLCLCGVSVHRAASVVSDAFIEAEIIVLLVSKVRLFCWLRGTLGSL